MDSITEKKDALEKAKELFGSYEAVAFAIKISPQRLNSYKQSINMPRYIAIRIQRASEAEYGVENRIEWYEFINFFPMEEQADMLEEMRRNRFNPSADITLKLTQRVDVIDSLTIKTPRSSKKMHRLRRNCDVNTVAKEAGLKGRDEYYRIKKAKVNGIPKLVAAVDSEEISPSLAAQIAEFSPEQQEEILALDKNKMVQAVKALKQT